LEDTELETSLHGHVEIYEAILARDPAHAAKAVLDHIGGGWAARTAKSDDTAPSGVSAGH
jgi:DNA-binding FadR family transcriptional regulator